MSAARRWSPAVSSDGQRAHDLLRLHLSREGARVLFIGGAGFDPRAPQFAELMAAWNVTRVGCLIVERRTEGSPTHPRAIQNMERLSIALPEHSVLEIQIFDEGAVVGGRNIVNAMSAVVSDDITDIVVDMSALSVGTSFPLIRYLVELFAAGGTVPPAWNLHVVAVHDPELDSRIKGTSAYAPDYVHGFKGGATLDDNADAAKLWLPQLVSGQRSMLAALHSFVSPHDTCPIIPFPSTAIRVGDDLLGEYTDELLEAWSFDPRNLVLAAEDDPTDLYRTVLTLNDLRQDVFREAGGSLLVLSPVGSKVTALGALMAALEHDLPVVYLEAAEYDFTDTGDEGDGRLIHVWLEGEAYPSEGRAPLRRAEA